MNNYKNAENKIVNIDEMSFAQEQSFIAHYVDFGRDDASDNYEQLGLSLFDGSAPSTERLDQNIDDTYEFEDCTPNTCIVGRNAYTKGWTDWCNSTTKMFVLNGEIVELTILKAIEYRDQQDLGKFVIVEA